MCNCGSGLESWREYDARGIYLSRVCEDRSDKKLSIYRSEVLTDSDYEADELIDPEED